MDEQMAEIRATLREVADIQRTQAGRIRAHAEWIAAIDERLDRIGHHLEVLVQIADGLIRDHARVRKLQALEDRVKTLEGK